MTPINIDSSNYIGRYAPSPTGPLHFGSLVTAIASYLEAKTHQGQWLLRVEDLDKPREVAGAIADILFTLEHYGFEWDGDIIYQSQRFEQYQASLEKLEAMDLLYPCQCSRREIASIAHAGIDGKVYPGRCRKGITDKTKQTAWRVKIDSDHLTFNDALQGEIQLNPTQDIGDFILKRSDGLFAYQIAVVVDDAEQEVNHIVRGADLLHSTSRQILLQSLLNLPTPNYAHIPLALNPDGSKLSAQTKAKPISHTDIIQTLNQAFEFLNIPRNEDIDSLDDLWQWGIEHWQLSKVNPTSKSAP